jgi:hypothetical protein
MASILETTHKMGLGNEAFMAAGKNASQFLTKLHMDEANESNIQRPIKSSHQRSIGSKEHLIILQKV